MDAENKFWRSLDLMLHFFLIFLVLTVLLALSSFWLFGATFVEFSTMERAMYWQFKMLIGEWPWQANNGDNTLFALYLLFFCRKLYESSKHRGVSET